MSFQKITIIVATIILICCLIVIGFFLAKNRYQNNQWKPDVGDCPDYFIKVDDPSKPNACKPEHLDMFDSKCNLSKGQDFTNMKACQKLNWANKCNVKWDGITNDDSTIKKCK
jgi:hypothetical protein